MKFVNLEIEGVLGIVEKSLVDTRGSLIRVWDSNSVLNNFNLNQSSIVLNPCSGTLRGLHYQVEPFSENKVVECVTGKVFDVIVDLRKESQTYGKHLEIYIGPFEQYLGLFVPDGCAHGYLTLEPNSTLLYFMDNKYSPEHSRGLIWNDPKLSITWPRQPILISERDLMWPQLL
jgi:dTDP-4-dehydrorhamnose 3,5-epimerase